VISLEKATQLFKEGKFSDALPLVNTYIQENQEDSEAFYLRTRIYTRMGHFNEALGDFEILINNDPFNPSFITDRAIVLHLLKRNDESLSELDRAVNLDPKNPYRYSSRAFIKDRIGDLKGAISDYEKSIELDPEDAIAYNNLGIILEKSGNQDKAKKHYKLADELNEQIHGISNKKTENELERADPIEIKKANEPITEDPLAINKTSKISFKAFIDTIKQIFINKSVRKDFVNFLRSKL
jgi:tetratricopeptide (TPR) repeat protein